MYKINPVVATAIAAGSIVVCYVCLVGTSLAGWSWLSWRNYTLTRAPASLIYIPAGEFLMGSADGEKPSFLNEKPQHRVYLDEFWIDAHKVTNRMYAACVEDGSCNAPGPDYSGWRYNVYENPDKLYHPVTNLTWQQARDYCLWAGRDLPSEAQWEKAARGTDGRVYPWGDTIDCNLANYSA